MSCPLKHKCKRLPVDSDHPCVIGCRNSYSVSTDRQNQIDAMVKEINEEAKLINEKKIKIKRENLRDKFAGNALSGILSQYDRYDCKEQRGQICRDAYAFADEMMRAREGK